MSTSQHRAGPGRSDHVSPLVCWTCLTGSWNADFRNTNLNEARHTEIQQPCRLHQSHQFTLESSRQRQNLDALKLPLSPNSQWQFVLKVNVEYLRVKTTVPCYFLSFEAAESKNKLQRSLNKLCDGDTTWKQTQTSFQWNSSGFVRRRTDTLRSAFAWTDRRMLCVKCKWTYEISPCSQSVNKTLEMIS